MKKKTQSLTPLPIWNHDSNPTRIVSLLGEEEIGNSRLLQWWLGGGRSRWLLTVRKQIYNVKPRSIPWRRGKQPNKNQTHLRPRTTAHRRESPLHEPRIASSPLSSSRSHTLCSTISFSALSLCLLDWWWCGGERTRRRRRRREW